jgi:pimeloyl-ACP methyl ester carboxylesterase
MPHDTVPGAPSAPAESPAVTAPLAAFAGATPPGPAWFDRILTREPQRLRVEVKGAGIETLVWGEQGKPGLLLLHGNGAHADWWSFIAPFFADDYRVAALSWSGMGGSDWRDRYSFDLFVEEAEAVADAAGLFAAPVKPLVAAHSFGGAMAMRMAADSGARFRAMALIDVGVRPPELQWRGPPQRSTTGRLSPDLASALARFRLAPAQPCENLYILDYIGRRSLIEVEDPARPGETGWRWRFDPQMWMKSDLAESPWSPDKLKSAACPLAFLWGDRSNLMPPEVVAFTKQSARSDTPMIVIPDSDHHVLLDQPLALVAALRAVFAVWNATPAMPQTTG